MSRYLTEVLNGPVPQSEPLTGREDDMVANAAGGYVFPVSDWTRLERFLVLGSEGGSYYTSQRALTAENAGAVARCIVADGKRAVDTIARISAAGRAPRNDPALFALALAASSDDEATRTLALRALPEVARIGTHLFHFAEYAAGMRGWGRALRRAVAAWYTERPVADLAYQAVKYQQRDGWGHRDLLRLAHPVGAGERDVLFSWITRGAFDRKRPGADGALRIVEGFERAKWATSTGEIVALIRSYGLTREMIPTPFLTDASVWEALLERMPYTALVRNLATMTRVGLITPLSEAADMVSRRLADGEALRKARVHPVAILAAIFTYRAGRGIRGRNTWKPVREVRDALDDAFYLSFGNVPATGKRYYIGLDVSGSMGSGTLAGIPGLTPRVASAAMAMTIARVEKRYHIAGFTGGYEGTLFGNWFPGKPSLQPLDISGKDRLGHVCERTDRLPMGATDCSLPMRDAYARGIEADVFVVLTDSETWYGPVHPAEALREYRQRTGIPAKLVVVGMVSNGVSIADPEDAGMLDVVGFDSATPNVIADFASN